MINIIDVDGNPDLARNWLDISDTTAIPKTLSVAIHQADHGIHRIPREIDLVLSLSQQVDLVLILDTEIHDTHWTFFNPHIPGNVWFFGPGHARGQWISFLSFYWDLQKLYQKLPHVLENLQPWAIKPVAFDALLGRVKSHREFVKHKILQEKLESQFVLRYDTSGEQASTAQGWIWPEGVVPLQHSPPLWGCHAVDYYGETIMQALCLPVGVYNHSCYSIVAETHFSNELQMVTEKSGRCMIARRLFVCFGSRGYLRFLQRNGFRTFGTIIDESYDDIEDHVERWERAWLQVRWLCNQPQALILAQARPILEHNFNRIMQSDFMAETKARMHQLLIN